MVYKVGMRQREGSDHHFLFAGPPATHKRTRTCSNTSYSFLGMQNADTELLDFSLFQICLLLIIRFRQSHLYTLYKIILAIPFKVCSERFRALKLAFAEMKEKWESLESYLKNEEDGGE